MGRSNHEGDDMSEMSTEVAALRAALTVFWGPTEDEA